MKGCFHCEIIQRRILHEDTRDAPLFNQACQSLGYSRLFLGHFNLFLSVLICVFVNQGTTSPMLTWEKGLPVQEDRLLFCFRL